MHLSTVERKVLNAIQKDAPLQSRPFKAISEKLGMKEEQLLKSIKRLKEKGFIRNFSASINHRRLGFASTLIALRLPLGKIESVAKKIIKYEEVTHCFLRRGKFNLWLVFITPKKKRLSEFLNRIAAEIGKENMLNLYTKRQFKLKTYIKI